MGLFDFLFGKKKEEEETVEEILEYVPDVVCEKCGKEIISSEPRRKFSGKSFHRSCFKKMKKEAKKIAFG